MFLLENSLETHTLVRFPEEGTTAIVPIGLVSGEIKQGSLCNVLWNHRKVYPATLLYSGTCLYWQCMYLKKAGA